MAETIIGQGPAGTYLQLFGCFAIFPMEGPHNVIDGVHQAWIAVLAADSSKL